MSYNIKIVLITPSLKAGGLERVVSTLANAGTRLHEMTVITLDSQNSFYYLNTGINLIQPSVKITQQNKGIRFFTNGVWLRKMVTNIKPDVVCSFGEKYNPYVIFFLSGLTIPVYVANRTSPLSSLNGSYGLINPIAYRLAAGVILQTKQSVQLLKGKYNLNRKEVIGNPVDLNYPEIERERIIFNVGSIGGKKNQDYLIRYFKEINNPYWELHFAGDGPYKKKCQELVYYLNLNDLVKFYGIVRDIKPLYSRSSIFAFTSTKEGFPNALAEAMAAGCACIAYDCVSGPSDIIDDGVNGFLIPLGDEQQYIEKLKSLIDNADMRIQFGKEAQKKMKQFESDAIADRFYKFITEKV